jgi:hypothetical protein
MNDKTPEQILVLLLFILILRNCLKLSKYIYMNDAILSLLITSCAAIIGLLIRYAFYSKCDKITCCWCCEIHRQVNYENKENENDNTQEIKIDVKTPEQKIMKK